MKKFLSAGLIALLAMTLVAGNVQAFAGWDKGFKLESDDGNFKMKIGGRSQFQYTMQRMTGNQKTGATVATTPADRFQHGFNFRRLRLQATGTLYQKLDWFTILHTSTATTGNPNTTWFGGFTYNFVPEFYVSGGMVQIPLDRMGEDSSAWYLGVEAPLTATQEDGLKDLTIARSSFGAPFDLGIRFDGDLGKRFSYALGVGNGEGFKNTNVNNELNWGVRLQVNALDAAPFKQTDFEWSEDPKLSFGVGNAFEAENAADGNVAGLTRDWSWTMSGDTAFRYRGFSLNAEIYHRTIRLNGSSIEDTNNDNKLMDNGYYANIGYYLIPKKLEAMLTAAQIFREGPDNNANEFGTGLNWYIHENDVKLQFDYTNVLDYDDIAGLNNATYHRFRWMFSMFL
ncbi:MAG: hypothetical protein Q7S68_01110 [Deltaproteobacteria bacterium]|nr:hypothetical protein [Deltaproteobacteria bacterium]